MGCVYGGVWGRWVMPKKDFRDQDRYGTWGSGQGCLMRVKLCGERVDSTLVEWYLWSGSMSTLGGPLVQRDLWPIGCWTG